MRRLIFISLILILFAGCATRYQENKGFFSRGGYSGYPIGEDAAFVSFSGDQHTSRETVEKYFLYRCAEYTISKNYLYFTIDEKHIDIKENEHHWPTTVDTTIKKKDDGTTLKHSFINHGGVSRTTAYTKSGTIKMFENNLEKQNAYNAKDIVKNLEPYIKRSD